MSEVYFSGHNSKAAFKPETSGWGVASVIPSAGDQIHLVNATINYVNEPLEDPTLDGEGAVSNYAIIGKKVDVDLNVYMTWDGPEEALLAMVMGSGSAAAVSGSSAQIKTLELAPIHTCASGSQPNPYINFGTLALSDGRQTYTVTSFQPIGATIVGAVKDNFKVNLKGPAYSLSVGLSGSNNVGPDDWSFLNNNPWRFSNLTFQQSDYSTDKASFDADDVVNINNITIPIERNVDADIQDSGTGLYKAQPVENAKRALGMSYTVGTFGKDRAADKRDFMGDVRDATAKMGKIVITGPTSDYSFSVYAHKYVITAPGAPAFTEGLYSPTYECKLYKTADEITLMEQGTNKNELVLQWKNTSVFKLNVA